ncbi:YadA-like family protein [Gallibacterium anatis]|uniref:YadA-like family protein n=1 Tax=Gallibacterium anatis TaxID=750 RepID=UPI0039FD6EBB
MNKIYKVIFNRNKNRYEIVSELASSRGKCKVKVGKQIGKLFMTGLLATFLSSVALAADEEVKVKYDATTGTIKIFNADGSQELASYAVGGKIAEITGNGTDNPANTIALGQNSTVLQSNTIAIGTDAHAGNAGGSDDTNGRIAIGTKTVASGDRSIALGNFSTENSGSYNIVQGRDSIGIGTSTSVFGYSGVSIGRRNIIGVPDPDSVKDGVLTTKSRTKYSENDLGGNSVIVGAYNVAYGNRSNVIGTYSRAMGSNSVAIGSGVQSLSDGSIAIGKGSGYEFSNKITKYARYWELPPEYKVLKQVLETDIQGDKVYTKSRKNLPKYENYGAGSSDPGGFIVEGKNALGIGTYTQVHGDSAIGLATGEMIADLSDKDASDYAKDMGKIMDMEETLYDAKEALQAGTGDTATLKSAVKAAEESLSAAKKAFRKTYLTKYSFVDGDGALGVGRQILAQGDRSMAVGDFAKAISSDAIAYGGQTLANGTNSMAIGGKAHVGTTDTSFDNSMAIGSHTNVQAGNAVALGAFSEVTGENSLALGFGKQTDSAITYNSVSGKDSTLIGSYGNIAGNNSILIGSSGSIANDRVVGLGNNINIEAADPNDQENNTAGSVFLGDHAGYVKDSKRSRSLGQVDVVGSTEKMELTESLSSTKGALRDYTKDFIYIYMLERQDDGPQIGAPIAVRSDFAGGDSTVGVVSVGSTYQQQFNSLEDIKDYHSKVGSLITVPVEVTVQVTKNGVPLGEQQQTRYFAADSTRDTIYADNTLSEKDKAKVWKEIQTKTSTPNTTYTVFETRRIQNVAPGLIGLNSTDAINGSQLFATNQMLGNLVGSLKKTLGDNVTVTEDGEITVAGDIKTLGWIAKADTVSGSNGTVAYGADKKMDETEEAYQARKAKLEKDGYIVDASKVMTFKAGKNIGLVQKPGEFSISTIDTPSFTSVELRGETKNVDGSKVTPVTMLDSSGMQVYTETGDAGPTTTKKVSTTVNNEGVTTDGTVKVTNGEDGGKDLVSLGKGSATTGETDQDFGTIHVDGKQGADGTITIDRGTKSLTDTANVGTNREQEIGANNPVAGMDRITYTTKGPNDSTINHEVATLDDGFFLTTSKDVTENKAAAKVKLNNTIKFTDGANTKVSTVDSEKGIHELHVDVTGLPVSYTDNDGDAVTKIGDKYYKSNQVVDGKPIDGAVAVPADKVTNNVKVVNKDGGTTEQGSIGNVKSVFDSTIGNGGDTGSQIDDINDANKVEKVPGTNKFIKDLTTLKGETPADKEKLNSVSTVGDLQKVALTPLFFEGDTAESATTKNAFGRKLSEKAKILGGQKDVTKLTDNNIGVVSNGSDTLTIKLAKELQDLDSVKVSNGKDGDDAKDLVTIGKEVNSDAAPGTDGENGTIGLNGKNGSEAVITIDRGTKSMNDKVNLGTDPSQDISGTNTAANMDRITYTTKGPNDSTINHEVATLDDGFFLTTSKDVTDNKAAAKVKLNNTIKFTDGANTKVSNVESKDGIHSLHIDVNGLPVVYTDKDGNKLTKVGDKFYKDDQFDNGTLKPNATPSEAKNISIVNPDGSISKTDGSVPTTVNNVGSSIGGDVNNGAPTGSTINGEPGNNSFIDNLNKVGGTGDDAISKNAVVTTGDLKNLADTSLFFAGDSADGVNEKETTADKNAFGRKLSQQMKILGGVDLGLQDSATADQRKKAITDKLTDGNIGVISDGTDTLTVKLAKNLKDLDSTTYTSPTTKTDDGKATSTMKVDGNGIRFVDDKDTVKTDAPSLTTDGIDGGNKQITNIGSGLKNGDTTISISDLKDPNKVPSTSPVLNNAVNVGDLKNIIDTGFKLNTSGQPTKPGASTVKIGDTINIIDGANTKVSAIDDSTTGTHTFHIDVNGLPMSYVDSDGNPLTKIGDKFYKTSDLVNGVPPAGTAEVPANKVTSNVSMLDNTGSHTGVAPQIKNVGSGLVDNKGETIKPNELLNMMDVNNPVLKNAVNVGDLKQVAAAAKTEVTGTGEAFVTDTEEEDGHIIYNVHVDKILAHKDADGNELVRGGDGKYYTNEAIKDKTYIPSENKWYSNSDLTDGKPNKDAQAVIPDPVDQSNVKTSLVNPNAGVGAGTDTSMTLDNVKSGIGGDAGNGIKDGTTVDGTKGDNTFIKNLDNVGGTGKDAIDKTTVVNAGDLKNLAETPLFFSGDAADGKNGNVKNTFGRKLSEEAKIVGGVTTPANLTDNNIGVVSNGSDTLTIKLAKQLTGLDSATYTSPTTKTDDGEATSTMKVDGNGIRFVDDKDTVKTDAPSLTTDGITGGNKQITNVGSGLKDGDTTISISDLDDSEKWPNTNPIWNNAVNVGDLKKAKDAATTEVIGTGKAIVTKTIGDKGQNIYNVHVDPVVDVVATDGKTPVVRGDDGKYYKSSDIENKTYIPNADGNGGNWYNKSDIGPNGKPKTDAPVQDIDPVDVKNNFVNPNGTGSIVLDNVKSGIGGEVKDPAHNNENTFIENINKVGKKSDDGTKAPDAISENTVVNAKDLKNVVDTGFKLNTSGQGTNSADTVKIGDTIQVVDGKNTTVSAITHPDTGVHEFHIDVTGLPVTYTATETDGEGKPTGTPVDVTKTKDGYQKADGTPLIKINENGKDVYYTADQLDNNVPKSGAKGLTITDNIRLINPKDGTGATKITNVAAGTDDTDAVNVSQLKKMAAGASTEVTSTGAAEVTKVTGANGQNIYNVHVDKLMTVKPVDSATKVARGGDGKYYDADDIKDKTFVPSENKWYNTADVDATTGKPLEGKSALDKQPIALDQSKLKNSVVNPNGDGATIVDNVKSGIGGEVKDTSGKNTFIENLDKVGKPANEGGIDKTTVVNAGDLKNLADTPLFFSGDAADDKEYNGAKNTKNTFGRKLSEEAKIVGGQTDITKLTDNNIGVVSNGTDTLTIKLAKDLTDLHSVTTTDDKGNTTQINGKGLATTTDNGKGNIKITTVTSDGITIVTTDKDGNNSVSLTNKGLDNGHHQIINVKSGLLDRQGNPVTLKNASRDILNNAVNVKDLRDVVQGLTDSGKGGGFGLTGNNGEVHKSLGETITLKGGIANKIENGIDMNKPEKATTDKNTYIDVKTSKNGSEKIMVVEIAKDLTDLNSAEFTDQEGNTTKMKGDGIYIDKNGDGNADISLTSEGLNNGGNKITNVADGTEDTDAVNVSQLNKLKQEIKQNIGDEINELNAYAPVVYSDKDGNRVIRKGNKFVKKNDETVEILPQDIRLSLVNADGKTTNPSTLQNVAKGVQDTDAVNVKQLKEATEKPLTFNGDAGSSSAKLGETVAIKGGANSDDLTDNNIGVIADSTTKTLNVKLSKKLKGLESAEFVDNNGNTTNITGDGVHISGGNGSNVSLTSQGLNNGGNRITNVAPGVEATDAVNVSQLNQVGAALHNRINNVAKGAYGGVASAGAMASLPQAYLPGKSMVAAGASHYRGESAVALGASRISDNGKIILKLNASHNTSGNTMVGAGVGYQF